jgi:anti-sigma-K factor RskA
MNDRALNDHDKLKSLIAPYSMGALPDDEIRFVRAHILECEECMAEADALFEASSTLSLLIEEVELPKGFADRIIKAARGSDEIATVKLPGRWRIAAVAGVAALAATSLILGVLAFDARRVIQRNEEVLAELIQQSAGTELRGDRGEIGKLVTTDEGSVLVLAGLDAAPTGKSYELWFIGDSPDPVSAAVFNTSGDLSVVETDLDFDEFSGVAVSVEPEGGSPGPGPTGEIILQN